MVSRRRSRSWDSDHENTRVRLAASRLGLKRTKSSLRETELEPDRTVMAQRNAAKKADETGSELRNAERLLGESQHRRDDAMRKGLPRHRWDADVRKWDAQVDKLSKDVRRWEDTATRDEKTTKNLQQEIRDMKEDLTKQELEVLNLNRRFQHLTKLGRGIRARWSQAPSSKHQASVTEVSGKTEEDQVKALQITTRATAALKEVLDNLRQQAGQVLRLVTDADGTITLFVDERRASDMVVLHDGEPVLVIAPSAISAAMIGKTLDVSPSYEGTQIILEG